MDRQGDQGRNISATARWRTNPGDDKQQVAGPLKEPKRPLSLHGFPSFPVPVSGRCPRLGRPLPNDRAHSARMPRMRPPLVTLASHRLTKERHVQSLWLSRARGSQPGSGGERGARPVRPGPARAGDVHLRVRLSHLSWRDDCVAHRPGRCGADAGSGRWTRDSSPRPCASGLRRTRVSRRSGRQGRGEDWRAELVPTLRPAPPVGYRGPEDLRYISPR